MKADGELEDADMADTSIAPSIRTAAKSKTSKQSKSRELFSYTIRHPPFAYAQIEVVHSHPKAADAVPLDALQVRAYCDVALRQFLGATGAAMPLDLLKLDGDQVWLRLPREDLSLFAAALAAWSAVGREGVTTVLRLRASGDWLGSLLGRSEQQALWDAT
ncbi:hypothetical protein SPI_03248 [Niveomyces insectorum RCEF 264]|uniref:Ribonucleases P/MRP subunit Pop8-like domain-containing protein n=1 Tax=Niveomyces insectorum RCEF 264 TaxID=1081102 RepID=A0A167X6R8_9HYPO|nr:hypothetical protein SPI_03248 [Niveomyces insectorum RCEF 264]